MHLLRTLPLFASLVASAAASAVVKRQASSTSSAAGSTTTLTPDDPDTECTNTASSRQCWGNGFSIATDFDQKFPDTGKTVPYTLTITNTTLDPDGTGERMVMLINGQYPGPVIRASWGDWLEVTVNNHLSDNGTGIHWHGIRQYETCDQDGVPGITECPIAPGTSRTYRFHCTQYGTSWYHSHWSVQYGVGVLGPIVIDGPATDNYDEDLGPFPLTDWYDETAFFNNPLSRIAPPQAYTGLVNGMNVSPDGTKGKYFNATVQSGKRYRLRLINTSIDSAYMVSVDNHPFTVITSDFVPIMPYAAERVFIGIGQRLDVIIEANQTAGNYWFRADVPTGSVIGLCGNNKNPNGIKAIIHYSNATFADPTSTAWDTTGDNADRCTDESFNSTKLTPYWDSFVPDDALTADPAFLSVGAQEAGVTSNNATIFRWAINTTALNIDWNKPVLEYVQEGNTSYPVSENLINVPDTPWTYWVLQEISTPAGLKLDIPHPIHLHGHDFYVLGAKENSVYTNDQASELNFNNPPRRDTAMLPTAGWLVLAFETNNPGAWIMHCHIAWHVADGLATQFLESPSQINIDSSFDDICSTWRDFYPEDSYWKKDDSGV
ncbi:laccase-like multicopper oxidase, partial [Aureobasidium melanogenum]